MRNRIVPLLNPPLPSLIRRKTGTVTHSFTKRAFAKQIFKVALFIAKSFSIIKKKKKKTFSFLFAYKLFIFPVYKTTLNPSYRKSQRNFVISASLSHKCTIILWAYIEVQKEIGSIYNKPITLNKDTYIFYYSFVFVFHQLLYRYREKKMYRIERDDNNNKSQRWDEMDALQKGGFSFSSSFCCWYARCV